MPPKPFLDRYFMTAPCVPLAETDVTWVSMRSKPSSSNRPWRSDDHCMRSRSGKPRRKQRVSFFETGNGAGCDGYAQSRGRQFAGAPAWTAGQPESGIAARCRGVVWHVGEIACDIAAVSGGSYACMHHDTVPVGLDGAGKSVGAFDKFDTIGQWTIPIIACSDPATGAGSLNAPPTGSPSPVSVSSRDASQEPEIKRSFFSQPLRG